jgi:hypothetical protein
MGKKKGRTNHGTRGENALHKDPNTESQPIVLTGRWFMSI